MIIRAILTLLMMPAMLSASGQLTGIYDQRALFLDVEDGRLDQYSLLQAAMLCTAPEATDSESWCRRFQWHAEQCAHSLPPNVSGPQRAKHIFRYLHDEILTSTYDENSNCVRETLRGGNFNCITSTLIYICLCRECGLNAKAIAVPNHVLVKLPLTGASLVETTYSGFSLLDPQDGRIPHIHEAREISDVALLGRFYYNQAIQLVHRSRYAQALQAARRSCQLDPFDASARTNLLATLNNWSILLCSQGDFPKASDLIKQGLLIDANYGPLVANDTYVHQLWIASLHRNGQYHQADGISQDLLRRIQRRSPRH